jgi:hypothetical protein
MRSRKPRCSPVPAAVPENALIIAIDRPLHCTAASRPGTPPVGPARQAATVFFAAVTCCAAFPSIRPCASTHLPPTPRLRASAGRCSASSARAREESDGARPRFSTPRYSCDGGGRNDGRDGSEVATPTIYTSKQVARSSAFHTFSPGSLC